MDAIIPGSGPFKEEVKMSLVKIKFIQTRTVVASTIGVVVVSTADFCYVIALSTKFKKYAQCRFVAHLPCGRVVQIHPQDVEPRREIVGCYIIHPNLQVNAMEISDAALVRNQTIYLFSYKSGGEILPPGNVTFVGELYLKHDCPCPNPVIKRNDVVSRTVISSGEVLFDANRGCIGIVKEIDLSDRTVAMNGIAIRRYMMEANETMDDFIARITAIGNQKLAILNQPNSP